MPHDDDQDPELSFSNRQMDDMEIEYESVHVNKPKHNDSVLNKLMNFLNPFKCG